jgi:long-chain acyl-CoA synthetase
MKIGAITVMNNPLYSDVELEHQFNDSGAIALITMELLGDRMIDLRPKTKINQIIYMTVGDYLPFPKNHLFPLVAKKKGLSKAVKAAQNVFKWLDCIAPTPPKVKLSFDDVAMYQYTRGTTGVSKGVVLTYGNLSKQGQEIMLGAPPYFHAYGVTSCMNMSIAYAWTQVLIPRPHAAPLMEAIKTYKPTFAPLVTAIIIGILNYPHLKTTDLSSIKVAFSGSAPLAVETINDFEKISGAVIIEGFGVTETSPDTHANPYPGLRKVGSIGLPVPDTQFRIVSLDDEVTDLPFGERGELVVKGPQVMREYNGKPGETANILGKERRAEEMAKREMNKKI